MQMKGVHPVFEAKGIRHKTSKTGVPVIKYQALQPLNEQFTQNDI